MKLPPVVEAETWVQVQVHFVTKNVFLVSSFVNVPSC